MKGEKSGEPHTLLASSSSSGVLAIVASGPVVPETSGESSTLAASSSSSGGLAIVASGSGGYGSRPALGWCERIWAVAQSQDQRLRDHGRLRVDPGYDATDPFICDEDTRFEQPQLGSLFYAVGSGLLVAFVGAVGNDCRVRSVGGNCEDFVISRRRLLPTPTEPPSRVGDIVFVVGSGDSDMPFFGRPATCCDHAVVGGEEAFIVVFRFRPGAGQLDIKVLNKDNLAVVPCWGPASPWQPGELLALRNTPFGRLAIAENVD